MKIKNKYVLGIDMDETTVNSMDPQLEYVNNRFGLNLTRDDVPTPKVAEYLYNNILKEHQKISLFQPIDIYIDMIHRGINGKPFYEELEPLPHAIEMVKSLAKDGHEIVFVTKAFFSMPEVVGHKLNWLNKHFGEIGYSAVVVNKMADKKYLSVDFIIDDDYRVIDSSPLSVPVMVEKPWNKDYREAHKLGLLTIKDMRELPKIISDFEDFLCNSDEEFFYGFAD